MSIIQSIEITTPATASGGNSEPFDVDGNSRIVYIAPNAGSTLTENDSFELRRVIGEGPLRTTKQFDTDGAILLGASRTQFEVMIRGTYVITKILATTESVGVYQTYGLETGV